MISVRHLALAVAVAASSGCGSNSESPTVLGPTTPTPPTTAASTSTSLPSAAASSGTPGSTATATIDERTRDELLRTPVDYYEAIERAYVSLDYAPVEALSSKGCSGCQQQLVYLRDAARKRYRHEGGANTISGERILGPLSDGRWAVGLKLSFAPLVVTDQNGKEVARTAGGSGQSQQINLEKDGSGKWLVSDIFDVDS